MKRFFDRLKNYYKSIRGMRGVITILLVFTVSPLLSVTFLLVESARYQAVKEEMTEVIDVSAFSALANYDSYLDERFGLLAMSQDTDVNDGFTKYLRENSKILGNAVSVNSAAAMGDFALSDAEVLKQQVMDNAELSALIKTVTDGIDLSELIDKMTKFCDVDKIRDEIEAVRLGIDFSKLLNNTLVSVKKSIEKYNKEYVPKKSTYQEKYNAFLEKGNAYISAVKTAEESLAEDEEASAVYEKDDVKQKSKDFSKARDEYKSAASEFLSSYKAVIKEVDSFISNVEKIPAKLEKLKGKLYEESTFEKCNTSTYEWLNIIADQALNVIDEVVVDNYRDIAESDYRQIEKQISDLKNLDLKTIDSTWTLDTLSNKYKTIESTAISSSFGWKMSDLMSSLDNSASVGADSSVSLTDMLDIASQLIGVAGLYDANLNSTVSSASMIKPSDMSLSTTLTVSSMTSLISAGEQFIQSISNGNVIEALTAIVPLFEAVIKFLESIIAWVIETVVNLSSLVASGPSGWLDSLILYGYATYNLPNRANYNSGTTLYGYSFDKIYKEAGGSNMTASLTGTLREFVNIKNSSGSDLLFKGAETEYLLAGSNSELQNQSVVFFNLYYFRLLLDLIPVMKNSELNTIASSTGPGVWIVKLAAAMAEPLLDTIILVNGGKVYMFKDRIYMSYSGIVELMKDLVNITDVSEGLKNKIKDVIKAHNGEPSKIEGIKGSYSEHLTLLMAISLSQKKYFNRLQNLIQLEASAYYKDEYVFNLYDSYTYVRTFTNYTLNPMFNIDALTSNGLFTVKDKQVIGY